MLVDIASNPIQQITPSLRAFSPLSPVSAIAAALDESIKGNLEAMRDVFFWLLVISTVIVFAGVVLEEADGWMPYLKPVLPLQPITEYRWIKKLARLGWILICAGVMGEGVFEYFLTNADNAIHEFDEALVIEARREAGNAATSAKTARDEADAARAAAGNAQDKADTARAAAGNAQNKADKVAKRANELDSHLQDAKNGLKAVEAKRAELERSLKNLAICNAPRVITPMSDAKGSYVDPLRPMAGQSVYIEAIRDPEARRAARSLARALTTAHWNILKQEGQTEEFKEVEDLPGIESGVSVQKFFPVFTGEGHNPEKIAMFARANGAADKLVDFLHSYLWEAEGRDLASGPNGPIKDDKLAMMGALKIQIALYPPSAYVTPGEKEIAFRKEARRIAQEKADAEYERKREATLPPDIRNRLKQQTEEMQAKIQKDMSNGPCQVIDPVF